MAASSLAQALLEIQAEIPEFQRNALNPFHNSRYVSLDALMEKVLPVLQEHKVLWQAFPCHGPHGEPALRYKFTHIPSADVEEHVMPLMLTKGTPQDQGSAITYARRYSLVAALNLVIDQDDDGQAATEAANTPPPPPSTPEPQAAMTADEQNQLRANVAELAAELKKNKPEWAKVAEWAKQREIDMSSPPADKLRAVERALRRKLESLKKAQAAKK